MKIFPPNRLALESSPYLLQHAHNPVAWYPFGQEALNQAKVEDKPILLSIGYAACHWCHVMAHESFEDPETAALMNRLFINIKVDKEERPDLDKIYQTAHFLLTRQGGGWPLTVFLTPDTLTPFFSGTYFPLVGRYQLPAFKDVLRGIAEFYRQRKSDIVLQNQELLRIIQQLNPITEESVYLNAKPISMGLQTLTKNIDRAEGGFRGAPKFVQAPKQVFLLAFAPQEVFFSLEKLVTKGIYDQLDSGFFRYAVDESWKIPHFEKMLYDNAQLLFLYARMASITKNKLFLCISRALAIWMITTMQGPEGGFYSSIDADSEGEEGKYYVWDKSELANLLTAEEFEIVQNAAQLQHAPNFEGKWHLQHLTYADTPRLLQSAKIKLLTARQKRVSPMQDQKMLTAWNALAIKSLFETGKVLNNTFIITAAQKVLHFILTKPWENGHLFASYKEGRLTSPAFLDDYAFLLDTLLYVLQYQWQRSQLQLAIQLAEILLDQFYDEVNGGFFFTSKHQETILFRPKTMTDEMIPSGNGIATQALLLLGHLLGEKRYLAAAEKTLISAWTALNRVPEEHSSLLIALNEWLTPSPLVIIRGTEGQLIDWKDIQQSTPYPVFLIPDTEKNLPGVLGSYEPKEVVNAFVCQGSQCKITTDKKELLSLLNVK